MKQTLKKCLYGCLILLGIFATKKSDAQYTCTSTTTTCNYISNGGFEENDWYYEDPNNPGTYIDNWINLHVTGTVNNYSGSGTNTCAFSTCKWFDYPAIYGATPDYYNASASTLWGPASVNAYSNFTSNGLGSMAPHSGSGYVGIYTRRDDNAGYYETVNQYLSTPLVAGKTYIVSMWVRLARTSKFASTFNATISGNNVTFTTSAVTDKNNWTFLTTCFTPNVITGNEVTIGSYGTSFIDLDSTNTWTYSYDPMPSGYHQRSSYYYIDDVKITPLNVNAGPDLTIYPGCTVPIGTTNGGFPCLPTGATVAYNWTPGTYLSATNTATTNASPVTTTTYVVNATVTYTNDGGTTSVCSSLDTVIVSVITPTMTITPKDSCNSNSVNSFTATVLPTGSHTYVWTIKDALTGTVVAVPGTGTTTAFPTFSLQNVSQNVNVCVVATNSLGCQTPQVCFYLPMCCPTSTAIIKYANTTYNSTYVPPVVTGSNKIAFGGTITVNSGGNLLITGREVYLEPNTKFVLNGTGRITFTNDYIHACTAMWDGIYANSTGLQTINTCRIEDAKRVIIDSLGTATISLISSYLNKNNMGIVFKAAKSSTSSVTLHNNLFTCSSIPTSGSVPYIPTVPNLTNAATLGAFTTTNMLPPYNTLKSYCGIYFSGASHTGQTNTAITIGASSNGTENVFDKMQYGSFDYVSRVIFQNNVFQNIKSTIAPVSGGANNAAIFVVGPWTGSGGPYYTQVGGATASLKNTFTNNDYGVANILQTGLLIEYNRFETQTTGIYVGGNNNNSTVNTSQNKFINNKIGINYDQNTLIDATISDNWFDNTTAQGTYADNFAIRCTEAVLATTYSLSPKYFVYNNYINNYYNGVYTALTYSAGIRDNEVHMRPDNTSGHFQTGIQNVGTNANVLYNNLVDMPSTNGLNWWQNGIFTDQATIPQIHCNTIDYLGTSILANSLNYTSAGNGFYGNTMQHAGYGFWLNANGEIGDQYYTTTANSADNYWSSCTNETYAGSGCNTTNAKFYTRSAAPYNIANPANGGSGAFNLSGIIAANTSMGACYAGSPTPTLNLRVSGVVAQSVLMQKADEIANGTLTFATNDVSLKQIARKQLYSHLALQQIDPSVTNGINAFAHNAKQMPIGRFFVVDSLINSGDSAKLTLANTINNAINTTNDVDVTQQQFNTQYIAYLKNQRKANAADVMAFENIAWLCPNAYGQAVHQARSVLFNITKQQYVNACEMSNNASHRLAQTTDNLTQTTAIKLYPNPSNGNVTFETADDLNYNLSVYNVLGEKVFEATVANKQTINLNNLPSATYMVLIHYNNNLIKTERMSIIH